MRSVKQWVLATLILSFLVIIAGGIVRTTQSGMGCPDWPRCFGQWIPPTNASELPADFEKYLRVQDIDHSFNVYHTWIEYFNRLLGVLLGVFAIIQLYAIYPKRQKLRNAYNLAKAFLVIVILTGLFGAAVVKLNLANISITVHFFFALVLSQVQLALYMNIKGRLNKKTAGIRARRALVILLVILLIQCALGTGVRMYIDDISKTLHYKQRDAWLAGSPMSFIIHRGFSILVLFSALFVSNYVRKVTVLKTHMRRLIGILLTSMMTGLILYYLDMPSVTQPIHLLLGTLAVSQVMYMILYTRNTTDLLKPQVIPELL